MKPRVFLSGATAVGIALLVVAWLLSHRDLPPQTQGITDGALVARGETEVSGVRSVGAPVPSRNAAAMGVTDRSARATADLVPVRVDVTPPSRDLPPVWFDLRMRGDKFGVPAATLQAGVWARVPASGYDVAVRGPYRLARPLTFDLASPGRQFEAMLAPWMARVDVYLQDALGRPVEGVDIGAVPSDAAGRVVFLSYAADEQGAFRVEPSDPQLVLSPSTVSWGEDKVVLRVLRRIAFQLDVSSSWPIDAYWLHCLTGCSEPGAKPKKAWRDVAEPILLHPGASYAVALRGADGVSFGLCPIASGERQQVTLPRMCRVIADIGRSGKLAVESIAAAIDCSGGLAVTDEVTDVRRMQDGPLTAWLMSHEVKDASQPLVVPAGVRFVVAVRRGGHEERFGPFLVYDDGELRLPETGYRVQRAAVVDVVVGKLASPLAISLETDSGSEVSALRELRGDCSLAIDLPDGRRSVAFSVLRQGDDGAWVAFHNGVLRLREGDPLEGMLDLRALLPGEMRGVLHFDASAVAARPEAHALVFRSAGNAHVAVVTGLRIGGRKEPLEGPGVARVGEDGRFSVHLTPGDYVVDVVDVYGDDVGFARQSVTLRADAELRVVAAPRVIYIGAENARAHGVPEVHGPHGSCTVSAHGQRGAAVIGARAGRYRMIWRDAVRVIEREIVVGPDDREKQVDHVRL
jgi:hypothetical protein